MISFTRIKNGASAELVAFRKNRIISLILLSFAGVIYGFGSEAWQASYGNDSRFEPSGLAIAIYIFSGICLFTACTGAFKDMHDRPSADVQMSMPLSSSERYLSRLFTVGYIWFFPFLISSAAGTLISALLTYQTKYFGADVVLTESAKYFMLFIKAALFIISVTVLCQCCTGSKAESKYTPVLLMLVLSVTPSVLFDMSDKFGHVYVKGKELKLYDVWTFSELFTHEPDDKGFWLFSIISCIISAALIYGVMFIYKKRDARSVGTPITFPLFLELTMFISLMLLFCFVHGSGFSMVVFFLSWLGSIILRIVTARKTFSLKKIGLWTALFGIYYFVFFILMLILCRTGNFGSLYRKPDLNEYSGYSMELRIDISESYRSRWFDRYFYDRDNERDRPMDCRIRFVNTANNNAPAKNITDITSRYAMKSSRTKGLFINAMYGNLVPAQLYECDVSFYTMDTANQWRDESIYTATYYLSKEEAEAMARDMTAAISQLSGATDRDGGMYTG